jgi:hypothetical protein
MPSLSFPRRMVGNTRLRGLLHPAIGMYFENTDTGGVEQWDGFVWQAIGQSGLAQSLTPDPKNLNAAYSRGFGVGQNPGGQGHGGGGWAPGSVPYVASAPSGSGPGGQLPPNQVPGVGGGGGGGGGSLRCSYRAPSGINLAPLQSSLDVFGNTYGFPGPVLVTPPHASTISYSGTKQHGPMDASDFYGTPNNGGYWGIYADVSPANTIIGQWTWDLSNIGNPVICTVGVFEDGGVQPGITVVGSWDGVTWTTVLTRADIGNGSYVNIMPLTPFARYRFWGLKSTSVHPGGYYGGPQFVAFMLWRAV